MFAWLTPITSFLQALSQLASVLTALAYLGAAIALLILVGILAPPLGVLLRVIAESLDLLSTIILRPVQYAVRQTLKGEAIGTIQSFRKPRKRKLLPD